MEILDVLLDFIFPPKCFLCGNIKDYGEKSAVCKDCEVILKPIPSGLCRGCGQPYCGTELVCLNCTSKRLYLDGNYSFCFYDGPAKDVIHKLKFENHPEYASKLVDYIYSRDKLNFLHEFDVFIPVPMHKYKEAERGFNQASLIANSLAKIFKKQVNTNFLRRIKDTTPQSLVSLSERDANVNDVFRVFLPKNVVIGNVLLVDDIYTTGSTANECAKVLKQSGAKTVFLFSFALAGKSKTFFD